MVGKALNLYSLNHPNKESEKEYKRLIGIDHLKSNLLSTLELLLDPKLIDAWATKHHNNKVPIIKQVHSGTPLIILSGEVGCGKTALAQSIATPLGIKMQKNITVFETPSNIRGSGLVGEISNRITEVFEMVKRKLKPEDYGILIIDEADDIATSRSQNQAHHEDRAGLNVLIKQIDLIKKEKVHMAVILITNRLSTLDPAVRRRTTLELTFERPNVEQLESVIDFLFEGQKIDLAERKKTLDYLLQSKIPYSFSDIIQRVAKQTIYQAIELDIPFNIELFYKTLQTVEPSPLLE
ncbi:ATPase family associated with various cellular activities (AAA) [Tenacibaculum sp. 190524A02b]|uniref:ATPase family associated with various cellular activities (AAA) n=1 Tax=Tenacibaculum vairaonense TaxID=3137860 RepID=A0ABM9PIT9_9FLAO